MSQYRGRRLQGPLAQPKGIRGDGGRCAGHRPAILRSIDDQSELPNELDRTSAGRLRALVEAVGAITKVQDDPQQVLQQIVEAARVVADAEYAALGILGEDGRTLVQFLHTGMDPATVERIGDLPTGHGILGAVVVEGRPLRLPSLGEHPASYGFPAEHPPMESFLGVPIRFEDGVVGNLYMTNKRGATAFTEEDESLISALAGQAAVAIEMATRYERERLLTGRLQRLVQINTMLTSQRTVGHALQQIVNAAAELLDASYAGLGVLDHTGQRFSAFIHTGMDPELVEKIGPLPSGHGVMRAVIVGGRAMRLAEIKAHPASVGFPDHHPEMRSFLGVPLAHRGKVIGDLYLTDKRHAEEFTETDELLATALAAQAAVIVTNAGAYERERELVADLQKADEARESFVNYVAHELKTPLVTMRGALQAMKMDKNPESANRAMLEGMAMRQVDLMLDMVGNLLEMASIESGRSEIDLEPVVLAEVVERVVSSAPPPEGTALEVDVAPDITVIADARYIDRILANLLTNAYRHGGDRVRITAAKGSAPERMVLAVADDGDGVSPEVASTLFQRFTRGATSSGTGLGLGLVKALTERFGGVASYHAGEDGGAVFEIELRCADS